MRSRLRDLSGRRFTRRFLQRKSVCVMVEIYIAHTDFYGGSIDLEKINRSRGSIDRGAQIVFMLKWGNAYVSKKS